MKMLEYGIPKGGQWADYLKESKPPTREEILEHARKEEGRFNLARIAGYALLGVGLLMTIMSSGNKVFYAILPMGVMVEAVGAMVICYAYLFAQISFASIQRMWERCENQEAELRKSIAQDL